MPRTDPALKRADDAARYAATMADPERKSELRARDNARYQNNIHQRRFGACVVHDRRLGREHSSWEQVKHFFEESCYYCEGPGGGVDRIDSALGHIVENLVPCCFNCNYILGDLPEAAKELLAPVLADVYRTSALADWVPPTMRRNRTQEPSS